MEIGQFLKSVSIDVKQKEIVGLMGPNGAIKRPFMMVGFIQPDKDMFLDSSGSYPRSNVQKRGTKGMGYLPQELVFSGNYH